jgi:pimeloyl-ACP methyl ester carboxylesterase
MSPMRTHPTTTAEAAGLTFDMSGSGPALVLLHGLGSSGKAFAPLVATLSKTFTTYVLDLPGHGRSPLPTPAPVEITPGDLARQVGLWMDTLGLDTVHVAGNSMGGWAALELAADGRAASVTALCPAGLWVPLTERSPLLDGNRRLARITRPVLPLLLRTSLGRKFGFRSAVERFDLLTPSIAVDAALDQIDTAGFDEAHDGMLHRWFDRSDEIAAGIPVTIVFGDNDRMIPAATGRRREHSPAHARWITLPRCGHVPMWDAPHDTARIIRDTAGV